VRLPDQLAEEAEAVARVKGISVNSLIVESLAAEIEKVRADNDSPFGPGSFSTETRSCSTAWPSDEVHQPG